jgi:hypothetical protein
MKYHCLVMLSYSTSRYVLLSESNTKYPSSSLTSFQRAVPLMCWDRLSSVRRSMTNGTNPATLLDCVSLLFFPSVTAFRRLDLMLRHCRNIHPMWVLFYSSDTKGLVWMFVRKVST